MKYLLPVLFALSGALPALAAEPMSAGEFEAYTTGKTLYFGQDGADYGVEEYLDGRKVSWSFLDGRCKEGYWFEETGGQICFVYEDTQTPQCWTFYEEPRGLRAIFENDPSRTALYEARQDDKPMLCYGPEVGA